MLTENRVQLSLGSRHKGWTKEVQLPKCHLSWESTRRSSGRLRSRTAAEVMALQSGDSSPVYTPPLTLRSRLAAAAPMLQRCYRRSELYRLRASSKNHLTIGIIGPGHFFLSMATLLLSGALQFTAILGANSVSCLISLWFRDSIGSRLDEYFSRSCLDKVSHLMVIVPLVFSCHAF